MIRRGAQFAWARPVVAAAYVRQRQGEEAVASGGYAPFDPRASLVFAAAGVVLGLGTIVVILLESG